MAGSARKVKSAERALDLLEVLSSSPIPLSATDLSVALGIPKSSLFHLTATLADRRYIHHDDGGGFSLGPRLGELVGSVDTNLHLARLVDPVLDDFARAINETTGFSVQRGDEVAVIATHISRHALTYTMNKDDLAPLYAVSAGKILLAQKPDDWIAAYLERITFQRFTPNTIQSRDRLLREIERARQDGFGVVDQEFTPGIVGIAAAVRSGSRTLGAINVAMPSARADPATMEAIRQKLLIAVRRAELVFSRASL